MSDGSSRYLGATDVHVLIVDGGRVLLLRRAPDADYGPGLWTLPSGHVEDGEDVVAAALRETREETGVALTRELLRCELVMQHRGPLATGKTRNGWFFRALGLPGGAGRPYNAEPHKHSDLMWADLDDLDAVPGGMVAYVRAGLDAIAQGHPYALHFQEPGTPVAHSPGASALAPLPSVDHVNVPLRREFGVLEWTRIGGPWTWHPDEPVPPGLPTRQSWGWLFAPDGRALVLAAPDGCLNMPGGTVEPDDTDALATLRREAYEEAGAVLAETAYVGYLLDHQGLMYGGEPSARVRTAARLASLGPAAVDPATGSTWRRLLASPRLIASLLGGGDASVAEARDAQRAAHERLDVPICDAWTLEEVPKEGVAFT
ncbi:NUDIX domain-containing protein [Yinghuangia sp. YIM S09857]|uniref:NUDIX domain-containing protein n=1 Tax=Yinghuangia sp. YIM S09857 TaxID=3436929 RepID=UPI003F52FB30